MNATNGSGCPLSSREILVLVLKARGGVCVDRCRRPRCGASRSGAASRMTRPTRQMSSSCARRGATATPIPASRRPANVDGSMNAVATSVRTTPGVGSRVDRGRHTRAASRASGGSISTGAYPERAELLHTSRGAWAGRSHQYFFQRQVSMGRRALAACPPVKAGRARTCSNRSAYASAWASGVTGLPGRDGVIGSQRQAPEQGSVPGRVRPRRPRSSGPSPRGPTMPLSPSRTNCSTPEPTFVTHGARALAHGLEHGDARAP